MRVKGVKRGLTLKVKGEVGSVGEVGHVEDFTVEFYTRLVEPRVFKGK